MGISTKQVDVLHTSFGFLKDLIRQDKHILGSSIWVFRIEYLIAVQDDQFENNQSVLIEKYRIQNHQGVCVEEYNANFY